MQLLLGYLALVLTCRLSVRLPVLPAAIARACQTALIVHAAHPPLFRNLAQHSHLLQASASSPPMMPSIPQHVLSPCIRPVASAKTKCVSVIPKILGRQPCIRCTDFPELVHITEVHFGDYSQCFARQHQSCRPEMTLQQQLLQLLKECQMAKCMAVVLTMDNCSKGKSAMLYSPKWGFTVHIFFLDLPCGTGVLQCLYFV